jgi:hypothetical protein
MKVATINGCVWAVVIETGIILGKLRDIVTQPKRQNSESENDVLIENHSAE